MKKDSKKKKTSFLKIILIGLGLVLGLIVLLIAFIAIRERVVTNTFKDDNKKILGTYLLVSDTDKFPAKLTITDENSMPYCMGYEKGIKYYSYAENGKVYVIYVSGKKEYVFELKKDKLVSLDKEKNDFDCITFAIYYDHGLFGDIEYQKEK